MSGRCNAAAGGLPPCDTAIQLGEMFCDPCWQLHDAMIAESWEQAEAQQAAEWPAFDWAEEAG